MKGVRTVVEHRAIRATCRDCSKSWDTDNALAVAARHSAAWGHDVIASSAVRVLFAATGPRRVPPDHRHREQHQVDDGVGPS